MVEIEPQLPRTEPDDTRSPWVLLAGGWHLFVSVFAVVGFLAMGMSVALSAIWACVVAILLSQFDRPNAMGPRRVARALGEGVLGSVAVAATCATAGIIVGVVTLTGVGLKFSAVMIDMGAGGVWPTLMLATIVVWVMGLAVPIAASYIICTVIVAPALVHLGVPLMAAHMFIFYYAVLSDVSPPTALSPFAAAAITGGSPLMTTLETWKYTLPAFLVPLVLVGDPQGLALLLQPLPGTGWMGTAVFIAATSGGLAAVVTGARFVLTAPRAPLPGSLLILAAMGLLFPALFAGMDANWVRLGALAIAVLGTLMLWSGREVRRHGTGAA
ncbi:MAG: TRAP transporter large permease subunit [Devosia sp.]